MAPLDAIGSFDYPLEPRESLAPYDHSSSAADPTGFQRALSDAAPALPPPAQAGAETLESAAGWATRNTMRAAEGAGVAAAILLTPTNTQSTTQPASVAGQPELGARITRAPGSLSGQATIFAKGADTLPGRDLTTLRLSADGRLTAPGHPTELGRYRDDTGVTLSPDTATALDSRANPSPATEAGGAGGKLPPAGAGSLRLDGECDENSTPGDTSPRSRLPTNGTWTGGCRQQWLALHQSQRPGHHQGRADSVHQWPPGFHAVVKDVVELQTRRTDGKLAHRSEAHA